MIDCKSFSKNKDQIVFILKYKTSKYIKNCNLKITRKLIKFIKILKNI